MKCEIYYGGYIAVQFAFLEKSYLLGQDTTMKAFTGIFIGEDKRRRQALI